MTEKKRKNSCYAYRLPSGASGVVRDWTACESKVSGVAGARYRGFSSESAAHAWLAAGAAYEIRERRLPAPGIYFDAGTGRGDGVEISVTDEAGRNLLPAVFKKNDLNRFGKYRVAHDDATNNYGELLALRSALAVAKKRNEKKIFGDSKLVIEYWSRGKAKRRGLVPATVDLIDEVTAMRRSFEDSGGSIMRISGGDNPADLGFHR